MGRAKTLSRLERLDELIGLLTYDDYHTAATLAEKLSISSRTIMRDLDVLRDKGYPIETDQGRGGGVRLHRHWGIGRLSFSYHEVIDLLLSLAIMEKIGSPIFLNNLKSIRHKISASFPVAQKNRIQSLRKRILVGSLASDSVLDNYQRHISAPTELICEAFFEMKKIDISYQDGEGNKTKRMIEPHYLFLNWPVWYVLSWDHLRHDVRCFRLDRINKAQIENSIFKLKNKRYFMDGIEDFTPAL